MSRMTAGIGLYLGALVVVIGTAAVLGRSHPADAHIEAPAQEVSVAAIQGSGAETGHVLDMTLHAAHVRGAEPIACKQCHEITAQGFAPPDRDRCLSCHPERKAQIHATVDKPEIQQCTACHDFLSTEKTATRAWECNHCHKTSPHGDQLDMTSDLSQTCGGCHKPHGETADAPAQCRKCHSDKADELRHRPAGVSETGDCLMCHRQHDKAENAADRCAGCHKDRDPKIPATALFAGGHERCIGCHQPHTFSKDTVAKCTSCHQNWPVIAADKVAAHADCKSCHNPHDVKAGKDPSVSCARCHEDVHPEHPTNCLGCHPPHQKPAVKYAQACTECHKTKTDHTDRGCRACHKEHAFQLTFGRDQCLGCHKDQQNGLEAVSTSTGHSSCGNCHG